METQKVMTSKCITLLFNPNQKIQTTETTLMFLPYFQQLFERLKNDASADNSNIFIDRDMESVRHVLEVVRSGDLYEAPEWLGAEIEWFNKSPKDITRVTINVGGELFCTSKETLSVSTFFQSYFSRWATSTEPIPASEPVPTYGPVPTYEPVHTQSSKHPSIFIDRNPEAFRHILSYIRNPDYPFPSKFEYELEFYGVAKKEPTITNQDEQEKEKEDEIVFDLKPFDRTEGLFGYNTSPQHLPDKYVRMIKSMGNTLLECISTNGTAGFGRAHKFTLNSTNSIDKIFLQFYIEDIQLYKLKCPNKLIFNLIQRIDLEFGNKRVAQLHGDLLYIWMKLYHPEDYKLFVETLGKNYLILPLHCMFTEAFKMIQTYIANTGIHLNVDIYLYMNCADDIIQSTDSSLLCEEPHLDVRILYQDSPKLSQISESSTNYSRSHLYFNDYNNFIYQCYNGPEVFLATGQITDPTVSFSIDIIGAVQLIFVIESHEYLQSQPFNYLDIVKSAKLDYMGDKKIITINPFRSLLDKYISGVSRETPIYTYTFSSPFLPLSLAQALPSDATLCVELDRNKLDANINEYSCKMWVIKQVSIDDTFM